jgi:diguanylate cyclase (GGDEF)-like protein
LGADCHSSVRLLTRNRSSRAFLPFASSAQGLHRPERMKLTVRAKTASVKVDCCDDPAVRILRLEKENARLKRSVARLRVFRSMAYRDALTEMWNRRYFEERLKEEFSRAERAGASRSFSVAVIDINGFKEINDQHGHLVGDEVLRWVGAFLVANLRAHDVACRTGGDEFMVLLPDLSAADVGQVIARLQEQLDRSNADRTFPVSLSIGSASWPDVSQSCEMLLARADAAMYQDKRGKRAARTMESFRSAA